MPILLGTAVDTLMAGYGSTMTFKNMSVIICGMKNLERILHPEKDTNLELPHCNGRLGTQETDF